MLSKIQAKMATPVQFKGIQGKQNQINTATKPYGPDTFQKNNRASKNSTPNFKGNVSYEMFVRLQPHLEAGRAHRAAGSFVEAIQHFTKAINILPTDAPAYIERGLTYKKAGVPEKALADYNKAIEVEPGNHLAHFNRSRLHWEMGSVEKALRDIEQAVKLDPSDRDYQMTKQQMFSRARNR